MIKCPNCARDNAENFNFCLDCGYDLKAYREAFPDGAPKAPPPPQPAMTGMHIPVVLPSTLTPAAVQVPLPPPPSSVQRSPTREPLIPPGSLSPPPMGSGTSPGVPFAGGGQVFDLREGAPDFSAQAQTYEPTPSFPPMPMPEPPRASTPDLPRPPAHPPLAGTGSLAASSMPPPPAPISPAPAPQPTEIPQFTAAPGVQCPSCAYQNAPGVKFCGNCGKRLDGQVQATAPDGGQGVRTMFMHAADMSQVAKEKLCKLITIDQTGREGMTFTIKSGETLCGRVNGVILFFDDPYVSPTHCKFAFYQGKLTVIDQRSLNGVYLRVKTEKPLQDGDLIRIGRQLFRHESLQNAAVQIKKQDGDDSRVWGSPAPPAFGRLVQILDDGRTGEIRLLCGEKSQLGREIGDIVMPTDGFISGRHCVFATSNGVTTLTDLGSSNGTYIRVRGEADVAHGDFILVGNQMLRVEIV